MNRIKYIVFLFFLCFIFSCKSTNKISYKYKKIERLSVKHLLNNVFKAEVNYNSLFIKKSSILVDQNGKTNNLKSSIKIDKENFIQISLNAPLGIELIRSVITKDSVKFVNFHNKEFFFDDISNINKMLKINYSYNVLQRILSNRFFGLYDFDDKDVLYSDRQYKIKRDSNFYILSTFYKKNNNEKYIKVAYDNANISLYQICKIDPNTFKVIYNCVKDIDNNFVLEVRYSKFKIYDTRLFPSRMQISLKTKKNDYKLYLKISNISFDVPLNYNIRILKKYKNIKRNE